MYSSQDEMNTRSFVQGHAELFRLIFSHLKSQAFRCAGNLGILGAIHRRGGAATISDIITETGLPQSKLPYLGRLRCVLTVSGVVTASNNQSPDSCIYTLTLASSLLVVGECDMSRKITVFSKRYSSAPLPWSLAAGDVGATLLATASPVLTPNFGKSDIIWIMGYSTVSMQGKPICNGICRWNRMHQVSEIPCEGKLTLDFDQRNPM
ncbi:unnamed protein product [Urochloa humidicola]